MFAVLTVNKELKKSFKNLIKYHFKKSKTSAEIIKYDFARFMLISVTETKSGINWSEVCDYASRLKKFLLFNESLTIPSQYGVQAYHAITYKKELMFNFLDSVIKDSDIPIGNRSVVFYDNAGLYTHYVERLVDLFAEIKIVTANNEEYEYVSELIYHKYGASIYISDQLSTFKDSTVIVSMSDINLPEDINHHTLVLSTGKINTNTNLICINDYTIDLPEDIRKICPIDINPTVFAAALWEYGKVESLSRLVPFGNTNTGTIITAKNLSNYLKQNRMQTFN